jgi:hypothetical protein
MLRGVVPRFRIAREGGVRRAATGYGVAPAFGKGAVSASLLPSMRLGHCGVAGRMDRRGSRGVRDCDRSYPWWLLRKGWLSRRWESMPGGQAGRGARARAGRGLRRWRPRWWRARA